MLVLRHPYFRPPFPNVQLKIFFQRCQNLSPSEPLLSGVEIYHGKQCTLAGLPPHGSLWHAGRAETFSPDHSGDLQHSHSSSLDSRPRLAAVWSRHQSIYDALPEHGWAVYTQRDCECIFPPHLVFDKFRTRVISQEHQVGLLCWSELRDELSAVIFLLYE
ncbi:hypothetical protein CEXT_212781 [Caerostris extrusa]|uniref:Uncharacterized protein n=1 Tax=Caerostris extrusa TaxID=172846 RepID=A0AAV4TDS5_CAEEX|nr:hypothetical protein CEXT_212781 [Caerostris extrusa]